jgi:hypothetical protein
MVVSLLAVLVVSGAAPNAPEILPGGVSESLQRALVVPGGRIVPLAWSGPRDCPVRRASVTHPIEGSGRVAVKVSGRGCSGWGWVRLEVWADTAVTTRYVRAGEDLSTSVTVVEREIRTGQRPFIPEPGAVAARGLPAGIALDPDSVSRSSIAIGDAMKIVFLSGTVAIEAQGRRTTCLRGRDCAVLPSGKHVEGALDGNGRLIVEVPR